MRDDNGGDGDDEDTAVDSVTLSVLLHLSLFFLFQPFQHFTSR